jgi:hypothetical protein
MKKYCPCEKNQFFYRQANHTQYGNILVWRFKKDASSINESVFKNWIKGMSWQIRPTWWNHWITDVCRKGKALHVHTAGWGNGYTLHVHNACERRGNTLHIHTAGCGYGYTLMRVHSAVFGGGGRDTQHTFKLQVVDSATPWTAKGSCWWFYSCYMILKNAEEKLFHHWHFASIHLPKSGIRIPASEFSPVLLVTD